MSREEKIRTHLAKAAESACGNFKHAAAITQGGKILCTGVNDARRSKWGSSLKPCFHAEVSVIAEFMNLFPNYKKKKKLILWVIRVAKDSNVSQLRSSKPCRDCCSEAKKMGINRIAYSDEDGKIVMVKLKDFNSNYLTTGQRCIYKHGDSTS